MERKRQSLGMAAAGESMSRGPGGPGGGPGGPRVGGPRGGMAARE